MSRHRRPLAEHRLIPQAEWFPGNPHAGDCVDTLCVVCGCCQHCLPDDCGCLKDCTGPGCGC